MSAVALAGVTLAIGGRTVLADTSMTIADGEFVGILGPNGSGKTTLMRAILGLVPVRAGSLRVLGEPPGRAAHAIGYMPQVRSAAAGLRLRGRDYVACAVNGARWGIPWRSRGEDAEVDRALALVDAGELADRPLAELSGGERQRLLLAQALLGRPRLLLLDEPLVSLDPRHQRAVVALVRNLHRRLGITVLFSAHEINPLLHSIDRVLYLGEGGAALGTVDEVITAPVLSRLYRSEIDVLHVNGRIFVMSGDYDVQHDAHRHGG
ncbi:MAG: ATP-binding cassette domain-containing protein [Alphaproteobacteria bacterium]|nr:ATP-binding cassette domain-containing protein [Alphaproteobacteria bacterium]